MKMHPLQIIGIVLLLLGTVFIYIGQNRSAEIRNRELKELSEKNIVLNQEITNLNKQISGYLSGDSFCVIDFRNYDEGIDNVLATIVNEGENPLYELSVTITDVGKGFKGKAYRNTAEMHQDMKNDLSFGFSIIASKQGKEVPIRFPFFKKADRVYNIFFNSRNGLFTEFYREIKVNGQWKKAIKVFKQDQNKPFYEKVDPEFPRDENGEIKWQ